MSSAHAPPHGCGSFLCVMAAGSSSVLSEQEAAFDLGFLGLVGEHLNAAKDAYCSRAGACKKSIKAETSKGLRSYWGS